MPGAGLTCSPPRTCLQPLVPVQNGLLLSSKRPGSNKEQQLAVQSPARQGSGEGGSGDGEGDFRLPAVYSDVAGLGSTGSTPMPQRHRQDSPQGSGTAALSIAPGAADALEAGGAQQQEATTPSGGSAWRAGWTRSLSRSQSLRKQPGEEEERGEREEEE